MGFFDWLFGRDKMTPKEVSDIIDEQKEQSSQMCKCGHSWIEHHNHASISSDGGLTTKTKECHFCDCEMFAPLGDKE